MMNFGKIISFNKLRNLILIIFNTLMVGVLVYSFDKGLDITDESLNLMLANPFQEFNNSLFNHHIFFKQVYSFLSISFSIFEIRLLRLCLLIIASLCLIHELLKQLKLKDYYFAFLITIAGCLTSYATGVLTLSYNSLSVIFSLFYVVFLIKTVFSFKVNYYHFFILSLLLSFIYLTKFTSAILFLIFTVSLLILTRYMEGGMKVQFKKVAVYLSFSTIIFSLLFYFYPKTNLLSLLEVVSVTNSNDHSFLGMFISFNLEIVKIFAFLFLGVIASYFFKQKFKFSTFIFAFITLIVFINIYVYNWQTQSRSIRLPLYIFFLLGCSGYEIKNLLVSNNKKRFYFLTLTISPFIIFIGTNNPFVLYSIHTLTFWVILIVVFNPSVLKNYLVLFLFLGLTAYEIRDNVFRYPYRQAQLSDCTEKIEYMGDEHFVSKNVKQRIDALKMLYVKSPIQSEYAFGVSKLIGDVLLSGKTFPSNPMWSIERIEGWLKLNSLPDDFFVVSNLNDNDMLFKYLDDYQSKFLGSYQAKKYNGQIETINCYIFYKLKLPQFIGRI